MSEMERDVAPAGGDVVPGFGDIGARLRSARERAGLSAAQAAERMHCDLSLVEALDAGRFTQLGAPVFARGHIRRYAELLGEPVGDILERWDREAAGHVAPPDLTRIPQAKRTADTRRFMLPLGVLVVVALFALLISWVLRDATLPEIGGLVVSTEAPPAEGESAPSEPVAATQTTALPAVEASNASPGPEPSATTPGMPAAAPGTDSTAAPAAAAPASVVLRVRSQADCWVEVYGADRKQLYFGLLRSGASTTVTGQGPMRVLLGNVSGVALEVNGRAVTVPRNLQRANTANVRVAADGSVSASPRD